MKAERGGFEARPFRNLLSSQYFTTNTWTSQTLGQSGRSQSFPVVPGRGGGQPGQFLDKSRVRRSRGNPWRWLVIGGMLIRPGLRRRAEIQQERDDLHQQTQTEVCRIAEEFHAQLPREQADAIGAAYARYSTRFQDSIIAQVRAILQEAVRRRIFIPVENIFFDLAVRGSKSQRPGLNALQALLAQRKVAVLLLFSTNRLFRKAFQALRFVDEVVKELGIRCIFISNNIDTADRKSWELTFQFHAMMDQHGSTMYADNVRAGQQELLENGFVFGTVTFGYAGQPVEGQFTKRKRPRCLLIVDDTTAPWVLRIFTWYVIDRLTINAIVQKLNDDPEAPVPAKSPDGCWSRLAVLTILRNSRYRGLWRYGVREAVLVASKDYVRQKPRPEPLREIQIEKLRIIPDELWFAAQKRLLEEKKRGGRKPNDGNRTRRPLLLNGFFRCPTHDRALYVGGAHGHHMFCPDCARMPAGKRPLFSQLNRRVAFRMTCKALADLMIQDEDFIDQVIAASQEEARKQQLPDPSNLEQLKTRRDRLSRSIGLALRNPGNTEEEEKEVEKALREMRAEREAINGQIAAAEGENRRPIDVPSPNVVRSLIADLHSLLEGAMASENDDGCGRAQEVLQLLTGGRIELFQQGERRSHRGWLQGRFRVKLLAHIVAKSTGSDPSITDAGVEVAIDFRDTSERDAQVARAKQLYDQGLVNWQIAEAMECVASRITQLLQTWFESHGLPMPSGHVRRSAHPDLHRVPPMYQAIAPDVMALYEQGMPLQEIASKLGCDKNTITSAVAYYRKKHNLKPLDGRTRRKEIRLARKQGEQRSDPSRAPEEALVLALQTATAARLLDPISRRDGLGPMPAFF
jgi:site-specific DNA recombinase